MDKMKKFLIYLLVVVVVYFFVDFASFAYIKTTYKDLDKYQVEINNPKIEITESKATYINGYINGTLKNTSQEKIDNKYVKFEFYSSNNILLGKKYIKLENLGINQENKFEVRFNIENVNNYKVKLAEEGEIITDEELKLDPETKGLILIGTLIFLYI